MVKNPESQDTKIKWQDQRLRMVSEQLRKRGISDKRVLRVMETVPRHLFVPSESRTLAYADGPLPIGEGQTVSQPYMVAVMTQHLNLKGGEKILEIGTGSGYQSAVLMELGDELFNWGMNSLPLNGFTPWENGRRVDCLNLATGIFI